MNFAPLAFLAAFFALSLSWFGYVLAPQVQLGRALPETNMVNSAELYPQGPPGIARQGEQIYRAEGCFYCHSQQVRQTTTVTEVVLSEIGTNAERVTHAFNANSPPHLQVQDAAALGMGLPRTVMPGTNVATAEQLAKALRAAGAKAAIRFVPVGPDITRGWGLRRSVAADFLFDATAMPGSQRVGPDLANIGTRQTDANWQYVHLYSPRAEVADSIMPRYTFLFEQRAIPFGGKPSPDALQFPKDAAAAPPPGFEVVPKPGAKALVAYLLDRRANAPLYEAPLTVASAPAATPSTNSPAAK